MFLETIMLTGLEIKIWGELAEGSPYRIKAEKPLEQPLSQPGQMRPHLE
jgi:hypothetical protein